MKFAFNGTLILGTYDGANIELSKNVGDDNMFIFGARIEQVQGLFKKIKLNT